MIRNFTLAVVLSGLTIVLACTKDDARSYQDCDQEVIISPTLYNTAPADALSINKISIDGNCMLINFSASGCSGSTWEVKLIDSGLIMESNPPQRNLRLSLKNIELCAAYIPSEVSFDISSLQVEGTNRVSLNIINNGSGILYEY